MIIARYPGQWKVYRKECATFFERLKARMDKGILRCPLCGGVFDVHSYYERTVIEASGQTGKITIMRVICQETGCGKTQAIPPDFLMPYKRYAAVVIEDSFNSVDNGGRIDECEAAAEASTIMRWIRYLRYSLLIAINALQGILLEKGRKIGVKVFSGKNALERLAILVKIFLRTESIGYVIGGANAILTSYGKGYI